MSVLVTGASGFVGTHYLRNYPGLPLNDAKDQQVELLDLPQLTASVGRLKFDTVLHLAGQAATPDSFKDPRRTIDVNFIGVLNLLLALREAGFHGRFIFISSGLVYGSVPDAQLPLTEDAPMAPRSPYAVSKAAAELLCRQWSVTENLAITIARPFNHIGPGQSRGFVAADLARQMALIKLGRKPAVLEVGNLSGSRDFTDVRDVVSAYHHLVNEDLGPGPFNVCSGREYVIADIVRMMLDIAGINAELRVASGEAKKDRMVGSAARLQAACAWRPGIPIEQSLADAISFWERKLSE